MVDASVADVPQRREGAIYFVALVLDSLVKDFSIGRHLFLRLRERHPVAAFQFCFGHFDFVEGLAAEQRVLAVVFESRDVVTVTTA